jgi:hypothetical protein
MGGEFNTGISLHNIFLYMYMECAEDFSLMISPHLRTGVAPQCAMHCYLCVDTFALLMCGYFCTTYVQRLFLLLFVCTSTWVCLLVVHIPVKKIIYSLLNNSLFNIIY